MGETLGQGVNTYQSAQPDDMARRQNRVKRIEQMSCVPFLFLSFILFLQQLITRGGFFVDAHPFDAVGFAGLRIDIQ